MIEDDYDETFAPPQEPHRPKLEDGKRYTAQITKVEVLTNLPSYNDPTKLQDILVYTFDINGVEVKRRVTISTGEKIVYSASQAQPHLQSQEQALVYDPEAQSSLQASQPSDRELVRYDRQETQAYESPPATVAKQPHLNYSYPPSQGNAYENPQQIPVPVFQTDRKNPGVAAVLSFFWAGLGQIYNGQLMKGIGFIVLYAFSVLLCFVLIGFIILPIVWIIGIADAYSTAKAYNERQLQNDRLYHASLRR
jgi:TM2 domain-containing membrane protein YozV